MCHYPLEGNGTELDSRPISPNVPPERNRILKIYLPTRHPAGMKKRFVPEERLVGSNKIMKILRSGGTFGAYAF